MRAVVGAVCGFRDVRTLRGVKIAWPLGSGRRVVAIGYTTSGTLWKVAILILSSVL